MTHNIYALARLLSSFRMRLSRFLAAVWRCRRGNMTTEAAFSFLIIAVLLLGGADYGRLILAQSRLDMAARSGIQFGLQNQSQALNIAAIEQAIITASGDDAARLTIDVINVCQCASSVAVACTDTCPDGAYALMYLSIDLAMPVEFLFGAAEGLSHVVRSSIRLRVR